jgi:hypothetical protein
MVDLKMDSPSHEIPIDRFMRLQKRISEMFLIDHVIIDIDGGAYRE